MTSALSKLDVARLMLSAGTLNVHLDPRRQGVVVPPWFRHQPHLLLQFGLNLPIPIPDLAVDDAGIRGTLSFSRTPHYVDVPWSAVFQLVGDSGTPFQWYSDIPSELLQEAFGLKQVVRTTKQGRKVPSWLRVIDGGAAKPGPEGSAA